MKALMTLVGESQFFSVFFANGFTMVFRHLVIKWDDTHTCCQRKFRIPYDPQDLLGVMCPNVPEHAQALPDKCHRPCRGDLGKQ